MTKMAAPPLFTSEHMLSAHLTAQNMAFMGRSGFKLVTRHPDGFVIFLCTLATPSEEARSATD